MIQLWVYIIKKGIVRNRYWTFSCYTYLVLLVASMLMKTPGLPRYLPRYLGRWR